MYGLLKGLGGIFPSLCKDNPSSPRMLDHELRDIVNSILDDDPAVPHLNVLADLLPAKFRHYYRLLIMENILNQGIYLYSDVIIAFAYGRRGLSWSTSMKRSWMRLDTPVYPSPDCSR